MYLDLITRQVKYEIGTNSNKDINDTYKRQIWKKKSFEYPRAYTSTTRTSAIGIGYLPWTSTIFHTQVLVNEYMGNRPSTFLESSLLRNEDRVDVSTFEIILPYFPNISIHKNLI